MKTQIEKNQEQRLDKLQMIKNLAFTGTILGFVMAVGLAGYLVAGNLSLQTMAQLADVGPSLYASTLQLPQT